MDGYSNNSLDCPSKFIGVLFQFNLFVFVLFCIQFDHLCYNMQTTAGVRTVVREEGVGGFEGPTAHWAHNLISTLSHG